MDKVRVASIDMVELDTDEEFLLENFWMGSLLWAQEEHVKCPRLLGVPVYGSIFITVLFKGFDLYLVEQL